MTLMSKNNEQFEEIRNLENQIILLEKRREYDARDAQAKLAQVVGQSKNVNDSIAKKDQQIKVRNYL